LSIGSNACFLEDRLEDEALLSPHPEGIASAIRLEGSGRFQCSPDPPSRRLPCRLLRMRCETDDPASGEQIVGRGKPNPLLSPDALEEVRGTPCGSLFDPHIRQTQRTLLWTSTAAGVTASVDETVPGRMYSGMVRSCVCLTMQAPVWTLLAQARSRRGERCEGIPPVRPGAWAFSCLATESGPASEAMGCFSRRLEARAGQPGEIFPSWPGLSRPSRS
jgi:hypothetical protein